MTPLRRRFVEDLTIRNYSPRTIERYVALVARFAAHFGRSPEQLGAEEVRAFQLHLLEKRVSWSQFNQAVCALRLLYRLTLGKPDIVTMIPYGKKPKTIPCVLSADEVARLLRAATAGRDRMLLQTAYALGLRLEELVHLQVGDIDGERRVVHVRLGKGAKDRLVPISDRLLTELRAWWRVQRPPLWLFPGGKPNARLTGEPITDGGVQRIFRRVRAVAGINKPASMHTLRHSFATHMLEAGVNIAVLQRMLGHSHLSTTARYLHFSLRDLQRAPSLLDLLPLSRPTPKPIPKLAPPSAPEGQS
jgi:site-specific recombinase XerD